MTDPLVLTPGGTPLQVLESLYRDSPPAVLDPACRPEVEAAAALIEQAAAGEAAVYGVNTGFGKLASTRIPAGDTAALQRNLILSHCSGVGAPTPHAIVRLTMALKLLSLGRGASGVRWQLIELLQDLLARGVTPLVPQQGSVGASGDLAPLAHMTAVLIGEGEADYQGQRMTGAEALAAAGLQPVPLGPKEGLAFINGTQFSTALALAGLFEAWRLALSALATSALSTDAIMGSTAPLRPEIHALRGHRGQIEAAATIRALMAGSSIRESHREEDERVQDPYCIRCQPQVTGACLDLLRHVAGTLTTEANAATDNPLVIADAGAILSGGNFHGEPVALAADQIALAIAEVGAIAQRRVALMVDPALNFGLPPFLTPNPGLNSGYMIAEVTTAALMSENKQMAAPCAVDSTPTSASQEDHVSMSAHAARRLLAMNANLARILGVELLMWRRGHRASGAAGHRRAPDRRHRPPAPGGAAAGGRPLSRPRAGDGGRADPQRQRHRDGGRRPLPDPGGRPVSPVEVNPVEIVEGDGPIVLAAPHAGTLVPEDILARLNARGRELADTDWWIDRLYDALLPNATQVTARFHRYVVDANRDPAGKSLYPGQNTTGLCPTTDFDGKPIWRLGKEPQDEDIDARLAAYHGPYHAALAAQIARVKDRHGLALLYDCHSIRSHVPYLFEGELPVLNIGDNEGRTCAPAVARTAVEVAAQSDFSHVLNGRFKGGWTTRHYGDPENGVHAIQMEIAQRAYMEEEAPWTYRPDLAEALRRPLAELLARLERLALAGAL